MSRRPSLALALVIAPLLVACGGSPGDPAQSESAGPHAPTATAELEPVRAAGRPVDLGEVGSVVVPAGATVEDRSTAGAATHQVVVTFPDAELTAVEITWGEDDTVSVDEQTWTAEQAALTDTGISGYERARVTWPGSQQSVLATWQESVAQGGGGASGVEAMRLVVQDDARSTVVAVAVAPEGELAGSPAEAVVLSLELA